MRPRVVAREAGEIEIRYSDGILHNIHSHLDADPVINKAKPKFKTGMPETLTTAVSHGVVVKAGETTRVTMPHPKAS